MKYESKPKEIVPPGTHTAILYQIIDLGTQKSEYNGEVKIQPKVRFTWELTDELMGDNRPFAVSKKYTFSAHEKSALSKDLVSWIGSVPKGFDMKELLGRACNLTVVHEEGSGGDVYAKVVAISPLKKNEVAPKQHNNSIMFDLGNFDSALFEKLPDFMKEQIRLSPEYIEATTGNKPPTAAAPVGVSPLDDEIPF